MLKIRRDPGGQLSATMANLARGEADRPAEAFFYDPPQLRIEFPGGALAGQFVSETRQLQMEYRAGDFVFPFAMDRVDPSKYPPLPELDFSTSTGTSAILIGFWNGTLAWKDLKLRHVLRFGRPPDGSIQARLDMPDQSEHGIPASSVSLTNRTLRVEFKRWSITYSGELDETGNQIRATYVSGTRTSEVTFQRTQQPWMKEDLSGPAPSPIAGVAGDLSGDWRGLVDQQSTSARLQARITRLSDGGYRVAFRTLEDPEAIPYPALKVVFNGSDLNAETLDSSFTSSHYRLRLSGDGRRLSGFQESYGRIDPVFLDRKTMSEPVQQAPPKSMSPRAERAGQLRKHSRSLFRPDHVTQIQIEASADDLEKLGATQKFKGMGERDRISVTVREGRQQFTNVSMHLKGAIGSFRTIDQNPSITLDFDRNVPRQRFHGLDKLSLNNSVQDPTYLSERIARDLFTRAGIPAPRVGWANVEINGRDLGLYLLVEGYNKRFLEQHFEEADGNLYDGGLGEEIDATGGQPVNSGRNPKDQQGLARLIEAAREPNLEVRLSRMREILDVDRFIAFVALEVALGHWDGYSVGRNNYRLYHDPGSDRIVFLPHGLDQTFQSPDATIVPRMPGLVARALLETSEGRRAYLTELGRMVGDLFQAEALTQRIREWAATPRSALARRNPKLAEAHDEAVSQFCERVAQRVANLKRQLAGAANPLRFGPDGTAPLHMWTPTTEFGKPSFGEGAAQAPSKEGPLVIRANAGPVIAHWVARAWLERGRYRLEGKLRTRGLAPIKGDPRGGASLRTSHRPVVGPFSGDHESTDVSFNFEVLDPLYEVQFRCEVRASAGEAEFDRDSLQLRSLGP